MYQYDVFLNDSINNMINLIDNSNTKVSENIFNHIVKNQNMEEKQYINLIENIVDNGVLEKGRNGNTISIF